jgi:hypothetical protein
VLLAKNLLPLRKVRVSKLDLSHYRYISVHKGFCPSFFWLSLFDPCLERSRGYMRASKRSCTESVGLPTFSLCFSFSSSSTSILVQGVAFEGCLLELNLSTEIRVLSVFFGRP